MFGLRRRWIACYTPSPTGCRSLHPGEGRTAWNLEAKATKRKTGRLSRFGPSWKSLFGPYIIFWAKSRRPFTYAAPWEFRSGEPPKSRIRVGFGFRVSGFVDWNQLSLSVSGFGFRSALGKLSLQSRFRVSGFGFRRLKPTFAVGFEFRVSGFVAWNQLSLSVSGFGFRVSIGPGEVKSSESVSGFGFRVSIGPGEGKSSESVSGFGFRSVLWGS